MAVISVGWSCWLQGYPPSSTHSSSSNQLKSQPCIFREYVGMVFLVIGVAGVFGVAPLLNERKKQLKVVNMRPVGLGKHEGFRPINAPKSARTLQTDLHLIRRLQKPPLWATISSLSLFLVCQRLLFGVESTYLPGRISTLDRGSSLINRPLLMSSQTPGQQLGNKPTFSPCFLIHSSGLRVLGFGFITQYPRQ